MAIKQISAELNAKGILCILSQPQINEGENCSVHLNVKVDSKLVTQSFSTGDFYVEFKCVDGKRYTSAKVNLVDNILIYPIENAVLRGDGEIEVQIVAKNLKDKLIFKSQKVKFKVDGSINAEIPAVYREDFLTHAQQVLKDAKQILDSIQTDNGELQAMKKQLNSLIENIESKLAAGAFVGAQGATGSRGEQGIQGQVGSKGEQGNQGERGFKGDQGEKGEIGERGFTGSQGEVGLQGERGFKGEQGIPGPKGDQGERGNIGAQGIQGAQGPQGGMGFKGDKGDKGDQGEKGNVGAQGVQGEKGFQGERGDTGITFWGDENNESNGTIVWEDIGG